MNDIQFVINLGTVVSICAGLGSVVAAYKIIKAPVDKLNDKFKTYDVMLANDKKRLDELQELITELKKDLNMSNDMIYQMLDHMSTSNNTGGMKEALDKYNAYFRKN